MKDNLASYFCGELLYLIDLQLTELASRFLKAAPLLQIHDLILLLQL